MMSSLYLGKMLRLTPLIPEQDAAAAALWTYDPAVAAQFRAGPPHPLTVYDVRKLFEEWLKDAEEKGQDFVFAYRPRVDERIVGFLRIAHVQWVHGAGLINLAIGDGEDRAVYAREALTLALDYAFDELNLFRVTMRVSESEQEAGELLRQANFTLEVRQRQAVFRDGRSFDLLSFGMLRPEWQAFRTPEVA